MIMSPGSISAASASIVVPVISPAGTITQAARGGVSLLTKSAIELAPVAPSFSRAATTSGILSKATQLWPSRISLRTRFAPIRPSPTMPSCIGLLVGIAVVSFGRLREPWQVPGRMPVAEALCFGRPPRPLRVGNRLDGVQPLHQGLQDPPGFLDDVLAGEQGMVAYQRIVDEPLVRLRRLAQCGGERQVQVHAPGSGAAARLGQHPEPQAGVGIDPQHQLVGVRVHRLVRLKITRTSVARAASALPARM